MNIQAKPSHLSGVQLDFERKLIEEAREEVRSGLKMDEAEVTAWLAGLDGKEDLPIPELRASRKRAP
jgi:hypothetical protein